MVVILVHGLVPANITTSPGCGDTIFDSGGASGNYSNNELITVTVFPENTGDVVTFTFLKHLIQKAVAVMIMTVYNGPDTSSEVVVHICRNYYP